MQTLNLNAEILNNIFQQEIPLVQEFLNLLEQENNLLQNFRTEGLEELVSQKNTLLPQIEALENQRKNILNINLPSTDNHQQSIISATDNIISQIDDPEVFAHWEILRNLAKNIQELNAKNGNLLSFHLSQTNEIIKILQHRSDDPTLYGKQGLTYERKGGRIADKA